MLIRQMTPAAIEQEIHLLDPQPPHFRRGFSLITIRFDSLRLAEARILRQEMLDAGGEAVLSPQIESVSGGGCSALLIGREKHFRGLVQALGGYEPGYLQEISRQLSRDLDGFTCYPPAMSIRGRSFDFKLPLLMGIVNITADSFYDGGRYLDLEACLRHADKLLEEEADIIDLGAESSRPGAHSLEQAVELDRLLPLIRELRKRHPQAILSIDTVKPEVARLCLEEGADIINDIRGLRDAEMCRVAAAYQCPVILMHMQGEPCNMQDAPSYQDPVQEILDFFRVRMEAAEQWGINRTQLILDPGIGFGKTQEHNIRIIRDLSAFQVLGRPLLAGLSRKSLIGYLTGITDPGQRLNGTLAADLICAFQNVSVLRVHDVAAHREMLRILEKLL